MKRGASTVSAINSRNHALGNKIQTSRELAIYKETTLEKYIGVCQTEKEKVVVKAINALSNHKGTCTEKFMQIEEGPQKSVKKGDDPKLK